MFSKPFTGPRLGPIVFTLNTSDSVRCAGNHRKRNHSSSYRIYANESALLRCYLVGSHEDAAGKYPFIAYGDHVNCLPPYVLRSVTDDSIRRLDSRNGLNAQLRDNTVVYPVESLYPKTGMAQSPIHIGYVDTLLVQSTDNDRVRLRAINAASVRSGASIDAMQSNECDASYGPDARLCACDEATIVCPVDPSVIKEAGVAQSPMRNRRPGWIRICSDGHETDEGITIMVAYFPMKVPPLSIRERVDEYLTEREHPGHRGTVEKKKRAYCFVCLRSHIAASIITDEWHGRMTFPTNETASRVALAKVQGLERNV